MSQESYAANLKKLVAFEVLIIWLSTIKRW